MKNWKKKLYCRDAFAGTGDDATCTVPDPVHSRAGRRVAMLDGNGNGRSGVRLSDIRNQGTA